MKAKTLRANWSVMQRADDPDVQRANRQLKEDRQGGATGVALVFEGAHNAFGYGLPGRPETIVDLFDGVDLDGLHIRLDNHPHGRVIADAFVDYVRQRKVDPEKTPLTFSIDPTVVLATTGHLKMTIEALKASLPQSMSGFFSSGLPGIVLEADGRLYHNAGATEAQELGAVLSVALGHLKMIEEARHHIAYALPHIGFALALNQDVQAGIVKIEALRLLWQRLQRQLGVVAPIDATLHVETSMRMMCQHGVENNITRSSLAALAAVHGRANSLTVLPHSFVFGLPDSYARRIARDSQLIIALENSSSARRLSTQSDVEKLMVSAWSEFERFEEAGGVLRCLIDGTLAKSIAEARDLRTSDCLNNDCALVGTTTFCSPMSLARDIIDIDRSPYKPEGIKHCTPIRARRDETEYENALKVAPLEAIDQ